MTYKVEWKVTKNVLTSCPDSKPDQYTGQISMVACTVVHFETITENRSKDFDTENEAKEFIKNAPDSCSELALVTIDDGMPLKN